MSNNDLQDPESENKDDINPSPVIKTGLANRVLEWSIRLVKGVLVGVGAITPGLSGGVLMVVFGIYEPLLRFLANIRHKFVKNIRYFLPVGIGGVLGIVGFSTIVDFAFSNYAAQFTWLFIGFIAGTFPSLLKTSGKQGRKTWHWFLLAAVALGMFFLMHWFESIRNVSMTPNFLVWVMSGALTGLGLVVPGMSPSNFLIYLGLYQPMASGIRQLDFGVIIPLVIGVVLVIILFAKLVNWLFKQHYSFMYHLILGIVVGSTAAIIPGGVSGWTVVVCALLFILGASTSYALSILDEKHPHESLF
jgi:putative membrane protein